MTVRKWWEVQVMARPEQEDGIFWRLQDFGCFGMATEVRGEQLLIRSYMPMARVTWLDLSSLALWLRQDAIAQQMSPPQTRIEVLDEEDWATSWKQFWHPQEVGDMFMVYPAWLEPVPVPGRLVLRLDPGSAFGTGSHPTTQLCLEALEMRLGFAPPEERGIKFADIGCGSGVLSIAALLLGAARAYAVDPDQLAVEATYHNSALNGITGDRLWVREGSVTDIPEAVDGFACNILAEVIVALIPQFDRLLKPTGWGVLSGLLMEQVPMVAEQLERHQWKVLTIWRRQDWACLTIAKNL
ncbi:MAG: 50S ribosomal protein L11 methyltransferase [Oscillatoriales cyanobacterium SM2_2_1]|nr:50S ribosomal protein L11 methyltransferase [Oscillatoriales cyanobacterium SM2_2_1]